MKSRSKAVVILVSFLLGGLSLGAMKWLDRQSELMEERKALQEQKALLEAEKEESVQALDEVEKELETVQGELVSYEEELSEILAEAAAFREFSQADSLLFDTEIGSLPVNYDVENFRAKQRENEQVGVAGSVFGSLFGNLMQSSGQEFAAKGQENRFTFYERLTDFLEESYWRAVAAKTDFDGVYLYCQELGGLETETELFAARELMGKEVQSLYEGYRESFLDALAEYLFDLNCVYLIYNNTLTEKEITFLDSMRSQVNRIKEVLAAYDPQGNYTGAGESLYGYTAEKKAERGMYLFGLYAEAAKMQLNYLNADGGMRVDQELTAWHVGTIRGYTNRGDIVMIFEKDNSYNTDTWEYRIYDHEGKPMYLDENQGKVLLLDGEAVVFKAATEVLQTQAVCERLVSNAERMYADYANGVLGNTYEQYAY